MVARSRRWTIYVLVCAANGKMYVGQTVDLRGRMTSHKCACADQKVCEAVREFGWDTFGYDILQRCYSEEEADEAEVFWIAHLRTHESQGGYNTEWGGRRGPGACSEEKRARMSASIKALNGSHRTPEARAKQAATMKGRKLKPESIAKREATRAARGISYDNNSGKTWTRTPGQRKNSSEAAKLRWAKKRAEPGYTSRRHPVGGG